MRFAGVLLICVMLAIVTDAAVFPEVEEPQNTGAWGHRQRRRDYCSIGQPFKTLDESQVFTLNIDRSDGNVYLASYSNSLLISYDSSGNTRRWSAPVNQPRGVAASNGYIYVNSLSDYKIVTFNSAGNNIGEFYYGDISAHSACKDIDGVVTGSNTMTLYCMNRNNHIYQFSAMGGSITFQNRWGVSLISGSGYTYGGIAAIQDPLYQRLLVVLQDVPEVIELDAEGHSIISRFGHNDIARDSEGLCIDDLEYVLVTGSRDIRVFTGGHYRCKFPRPATGELPDDSYDVAIAPNGIIWVASRRANKIWLF